jgi:hypothetical protein
MPSSHPVETAVVEVLNATQQTFAGKVKSAAGASL